MNRSGWIGKALLGLAIVLPVVGFGVSIYLATTENSLSVFSKNDSSESDVYFLTAADFPEPLQTGNQVGYQVPEFTLELADGSSITSSDLVSRGKPTYLFFWATI